MKPGVLCLLLISGCSFLSFPEDPPVKYEYALSWTCRTPGGCERMEDVNRIDRAIIEDYHDIHFISTQDSSYSLDAQFSFAPTLPTNCSWLYYLTFFAHELERSKFCRIPGGFELELSIPNQDPTTHSMWLVEGRDVNL